MMRVSCGRLGLACLLLIPLTGFQLELNPEEPQEGNRAVRAAAGPDEEAEEPAVDHKAMELIVAMAEYLQSVREFTFSAEVLYDDVVLQNVKIQYGATIDVSVRRPDHLHSEYVGDQAERRFWYDGKSATLYAGFEDVYGTVPAQPTIDTTLDSIREEYAIALPLATLVYNELRTEIAERLEFGFYIGLHDVKGVRCHHLLFIHADIQWQVWIEDGKQLVPRKIVITYANLPESPQYAAVFSEWDLSPKLPDRLFVADPPESASRIEFLPVPKADKEDVEIEKE